MTKLTFAGLAFSVPDGWRNDSTIVFSMPPAPADPRMVKAKTSTRTPATLAITWQDASALSPRGYLEQRAASFPRSLPGHQALGKGEIDDAAFIEHRFDAGGTGLVQMVLVRRVGARMVVVTGTALESEYRKVRQHFVDAVQSLTEGA